MSIWLAIPSARPPEEAEKVLRLWRKQGYKLALWRDAGSAEISADIVVTCETYPGYAQAVNKLVWDVLPYDPSCEWIVTGGDDTEPDLNHTAEEIAGQCREYFLHVAKLAHMNQLIFEEDWATFGVMQPTGDRYAGGSIDRICGSPWMGREFCERVYGGKGPLWPEYQHMFVDEELFEVSKKLGILWQRPDLIHLHHHFMRVSDDLNSHAVQQQPPPHLVEANSPHHWNTYQLLFNQRKAAGFPGHEPIPVEQLVAR